MIDGSFELNGQEDEEEHKKEDTDGHENKNDGRTAFPL
jgi:hypothetical protein